MLKKHNDLTAHLSIFLKCVCGSNLMIRSAEGSSISVEPCGACKKLAADEAVKIFASNVEQMYEAHQQQIREA